jgi:hypothetical protein
MLRLLDGATQLKNASGTREVRPGHESWQRQAILQKERVLGELETIMK